MKPTRVVSVAVVWVLLAAGTAVLGPAAPALAAPPGPPGASRLDPAEPPTARGVPCTIVGTAGDDVLRGTPGDDVICGLRGRDVILGRGGDDLVHGNRGNDLVRGGAGDDLVLGGRGNDRLEGGAGDDRVHGHTGADRIAGGSGDDLMRGYLGADRLDGRDGPGARDRLRCGPGPDAAAGDTADAIRADCERVRQNHAPSDIVLDPSSVVENEPAGTEVGVLSATDADRGDAAVFALVPGPGSGDNVRVSVRDDTLVTRQPLDFEADDRLEIRVRATDRAGAGVTRRLVVRVLDGDDQPVAVDDSAVVDEDAPAAALDLLVNDSDPDGDPFSISSATDPDHGTVVVTGAGLTYRPDPDYCNSAGVAPADTFSYTLAPGGSTATVSVVVSCTEDPAVARDDTASVVEDADTAAIDVLGNDSDADGDPLTVASATDPTHGTVVLTGPVGARTGVGYEPDADYCNDPGAPGDDTFDYTLDGGGTATVSVVVTCVDDAPRAVADAATVALDAPATAVDVLANDTDVDGGPIAIASVTDPTHGVVVLTGPVGARTGLTYEPDAGYCNTEGTEPDDVFAYTLAPGAGTATVALTVTCDVPPVAVDDSATVAEDDPAAPVPVLGNDTDVDGGPRSIAAVTQPADGTVVITGGGSGLTYRPDADYCNAPPGTSRDAFTYTLAPGGSTATVRVTVTCVDDAPVAVDDAATVAEDSGASPVGVLGNDTDVDGGPRSIAAVTQPADGTVAITGGGSGLTYRPDADYCNAPPGTSPDAFTYTLAPGGSTATVRVTVTCVDDAPVAVDDAATVAEDDPAAAVPVLVNDTDVDGGPRSIASVTQPGDGTVAITGGGSGLTYRPDADYCNAPPGTSRDAFTYTLAPGGSTATVRVTVTCVDDAPVAVDDAATVAEDSGASPVGVLGNDTDVDGGPRSIAAVTQPADGTVAITGGGSGLTYRPDADYCNAPPGTSPDAFTYTLAPGGSTATVRVTVTCVDDAPGAVDDAATVAEDAGPTAIDVRANDTDVDAGAASIGTVTQPADGTVVVTGGGSGLTYRPDADYCNAPPGTSPDAFTYTLAPGGSTATVRVTVTCVDDAPVAVDDAAVVSEDDPAAAVLVLSNDSDVDGGPRSIAAVTQPADGTVAITGGGSGLTYRPDADYCNAPPGTSPDAFTYTLAPGGSTATVRVMVTCVDDAPVAVDNAAVVSEDDPAAAVLVLSNDSDVDGGPRSIASVTQPADGTVAITGGGSGLTYRPDADYCNAPPGTSPDAFTYTLAPGGSTATVRMTVTCVADAPTAVADSVDAIGGTGLFVGTSRPAGQAGKVVTGSLLSNDTDPDTPHGDLVVEPVTDAPTTLGGTITVLTDGRFTYQPDDLDTGTTDTFTYRVCDSTPCTAATDANATGTLSLPIAGQVWYVRNTEAPGGDGTSDTPFDTLAEAEAASGAGDTVYVFAGTGTATNLDSGYVMAAGERLIGESRPLGLDPDGGGPLATASLFPGTPGAQPVLTATNEDVVVLAADVLVDGVDVDPSGAGGGLSGGSGAGDVTVQNLAVTDTGTAGTQPGIELVGTTGVNRFTGVTVTNGGSATATGVRLVTADRVLFAATGLNTIATTGAKALDVASTNLLTSRWNDISVTGSGTGGIRLSSTTGQPVLGDGAGTDLSLQTTSGSTAALDVSGSSSVTVDSAGTDTVSATGGPAVDIRSSHGSQFHLDSVSSTNSANDGINLDTNLATPFSAAAGAVSGAGVISLDVHGGGVGADVSYGGALNDGPGSLAVEVTGRDGGAVTISGAVTDSGDPGGGVVVSGSPAGSTTFSGAAQVLNTGTAVAVATSGNGASGPGGHTVAFTGGGLDIDTSTGAGLTSTNGGQLAVTGAGNTITTTTGNGLVVDATTLDARDVTFRSISVNGAVHGIRLANTGTVGNLAVTGSGGACTFATPTCTGGNLAGTTGDAISLTGTAGPSLTRVNVHDSAGNGLLASGVSALSVDTSIFVDNSDDTATSNEANLRLLDLSGASSVTGSLFREARVNEVYWTPTSGTATLGWTGNTVGPDNPGELGGGVLLSPGGTASASLTVSGGAFTGINGDSLRVAAAGGGTTTATVAGATSFSDANSGVNLSVDGNADLTYDVSGATFLRHASHALQLIVNETTTAASVVRGRAVDNTIGNGTPDSGSRDANGISYDLEGAADVVLDVSRNTVRNTDTQGIFIQSVRFPSGTTNVGPTVDLTLRDNAVSQVDDNSAFPFTVQHGTQVEARRSSTMCLDLAGNSSVGVGGAEGFRVRQRDTSTFRLERLTGSGSDDANVAAFVVGQNDPGSTASVSHATAFTAVANGSCRSLP